MFIQGIFFGGISPKTLTIPPNGYQIVCSKSLFSAGTVIYKYITKLSFLLDNKHRKLFVVGYCNFMPKMHQNTGSDRTRWGAYALPRNA